MNVAVRYSLLWLIACFVPLLALATETQIEAQIPAPPNLPARGFLLMDANSGTIIAEHNAKERLEPASLTKILTAYVVFSEIREGHIGLSDQVLVSEKAWRTGGSRMFIKVGTMVSVEELLHGMIIQSGNDASVALAEHVAGSVDAFAKLMNQYAAHLGMADSHFTNPNGLPDAEHYTTAHDMAAVSVALIREFPDYYAWYSKREYTYNGITQGNRNPLLGRDPSADGVKTGHTRAAGYCLVGSAKREDMRLVSVVMGTASPRARAETSMALLNYGFRFYETHVLYPTGQAVGQLRVWEGDPERVSVGPRTGVYATIPRGTYDRLTADLIREPEIKAPLATGQEVGNIVVKLDDKEINRVSAVTLSDVARGGLWRRAIDAMIRMFRG